MHYSASRLDLLPILLIAISSDIDSLTVGVACGMRDISVPFHSNLFIAFVNGAATLAAMLAGHKVGAYLKPRTASIIGGILIAAIGMWVIAQAARSRAARNDAAPAPLPDGLMKKLLFVLDHPTNADRDYSGHLDIREVYLLALALSLNNVTNGIASGMVGLHPFATTLSVIVLSIVLLSAGIVAGRCGRRLVGGAADIASGVLLVVAGFYSIRA